VAPLKLQEAQQDLLSLKAFPRLKRRGPIEAVVYISNTSAAVLFPRLKRRGPIEAVVYISNTSAAVLFPRLKRRGPIEAPIAIT